MAIPFNNSGEPQTSEKNREPLLQQAPFALTSTAFSSGGAIPAKYTCDGEGINPEFSFSGFPDATRTIALIAEDPDAPSGTFDHWVAWNIYPDKGVAENSPAGTVGLNSKGRNGYIPPCPPDGEHRYFFRAYALDTLLDLGEASGKEDLKEAMRGHVLAVAELMGRYKKTSA